MTTLEPFYGDDEDTEPAQVVSVWADFDRDEWWVEDEGEVDPANA